ncbi:hypothetical protein ACLMJK_003454 [Lecanora helva]
MAFATAVIIPTVVVLLAQCSPVKKLWEPKIPGRCWSPQTVIDIGYFNGTVSHKDRNLPTDGLGLFVKFLTFLPELLWANAILSTGICAIVRTVLFADGTSEAEQVRHRNKSSNNPPSPENQSDDRVHFNKLTLNNMPSAMPSSMTYYQHHGNNDGEEWEDLESQASTMVPEKAHIAGTGREMGMDSTLEMVGDGEVHAIGEKMV